MQENPPALPVEQPSWVRRVWRRLTAGGWVLLMAVVVLPVVTLAVELTTHMCGATFIDPIPTPWHVAAAALVPAVSLFAWWVARRGSKSAVLCAAAAFGAGAALALAGAFALTLLPVALLGLLVLATAFWYFGIGLLGLLPLTPVFAFLGGFFLRRRLLAAATGSPKGRLPGFAAGVVVGVALAATLSASGWSTYAGLHLAASDDPDEQARGIRLLRRFGREDILHRAGQWRSDTPFSGLGGVLMPDTDRLSTQDAQTLYYRVTGRVYEDRPAFVGSRRGRLTTVWDDSQGGDRVGGILKGLALRDSFFEERIDEQAATAYAEWTLVFYNDWRSEREARARLALPPGAVVTRLTLWINGEPCEAAFGGRGVVRKAYEQIVRRNRDPVLVESCGPDRIQMQCFPVPAEGEMKLRIGLAIPLEVAADGVSATLRAPAVVERNFRLPHHSVALPASRSVTLSRPFAAACWSTGVVEQASAFIQQTASLARAIRPDRVAVVVDGSRAMASRVGSVAAALAALPDGVEAGIWLADDTASGSQPLVTRAPLDEASWRRLSELLAPAACTGGRCSIGTLLGALDWLQAAPGVRALVWVHGLQPAPLGSVESLRMRLDRGGAALTVYAVQTDEGPCKVTQALDGVTAVKTLPPAEALRDAGAALRGLFEAWRPDAQSWVRVRTRVPQGVAPEGPAAARELAALWAAEEVRALLRGGDPVRQEAARELALAWRIVTPVSSAVVLESQRQYQEAGLEPVTAETVPTVPEPAFVLVLLVAVAAAGFALWRRASVSREP